MTVESTLDFLIRHGYAVVFTWVLLEQGGVPIPSVPVLLAAGALAATGRMHVGLILGAAVAGALVSDTVWYGLGRRQGMGILHLLCRISLEPDACVRQTQDMFARRGTLSLLAAKFIPGLSTVATPLAGIIRMPLAQFVLFDGVGALLWAGVFVALGMLFGEQLKGLAAVVATMGAWLLAMVLGGLGTYLLWKLLVRQRFLRRLRVARISPDELHRKLEAGEAVVIVDLRHALEFTADPVLIPGAVRWDAEDLAQASLELPRDREVVLYCT
ncbi:MAG TPA: VTT domain-containing protein [Candidatus Baltobacteraceae bacterium]|nr:VTT domain-containing protein [Candidatus Baltobacteraceae bacterium]